MYKFRFKNLYDMHDNIRGPLDIVSGPEAIDAHLTTADNRNFSLLAILVRQDGGSWHLLMNNNLPTTSGDINVVNGQNAVVIMLYVPDGPVGPGVPGVGVFTLAVPQDISFVVGDDDDVTIEGTVLPVVIKNVSPVQAWSGGNFVDSFNAAVQNAAQRTITLKDDAQMGGTLTSIISLVNGHTVTPGPHTIGFGYQEKNTYIVCYDVVPVTPPNPGKKIQEAIYVWVSAGPKVDADGWGIVNGHIIHVPGNNPLSQQLTAYNKEIMTQWRGLTGAFEKLNAFSQQHVKELSQIKSNIRLAGINNVVLEKTVADKVTLAHE
ncbi:hypothetical protein ACTHGU_02820 [Chitinophagaceae bacterium MMS25-I14]